MSNANAKVTQVVQAFAEYWNRHDMNAFAELFAPDAEFVNVVGLWWKGSDEINKAPMSLHIEEPCSKLQGICDRKDF